MYNKLEQQKCMTKCAQEVRERKGNYDTGNKKI